jgi:hypothetical protein
MNVPIALPSSLRLNSVHNSSGTPESQTQIGITFSRSLLAMKRGVQIFSNRGVKSIIHGFFKTLSASSTIRNLNKIQPFAKVVTSERTETSCAQNWPTHSYNVLIPNCQPLALPTTAWFSISTIIGREISCPRTRLSKDTDLTPLFLLQRGVGLGKNVSHNISPL